MLILLTCAKVPILIGLSPSWVTKVDVLGLGLTSSIIFKKSCLHIWTYTFLLIVHTYYFSALVFEDNFLSCLKFSESVLAICSLFISWALCMKFIFPFVADSQLTQFHYLNNDILNSSHVLTVFRPWNFFRMVFI